MVQHAEDPTVFTRTPHFPRSGVQDLGLHPIHPQETPPHGKELKILTMLTINTHYTTIYIHSTHCYWTKDSEFSCHLYKAQWNSYLSVSPQTRQLAMRGFSVTVMYSGNTCTQSVPHNTLYSLYSLSLLYTQRVQYHTMLAVTNYYNNILRKPVQTVRSTIKYSLCSLLTIITDCHYYVLHMVSVITVIHSKNTSALSIWAYQILTVVVVNNNSNIIKLHALHM